MWIDFYFLFLVAKTSFDKMEGPGVNIYGRCERDLSWVRNTVPGGTDIYSSKSIFIFAGAQAGFQVQYFREDARFSRTVVYFG